MRFAVPSTLAFAFVLSIHPGSARARQFATDPESAAPRLDSIRTIEGIKQNYVSGAYPWLSPDGLRLYYTWCGDSRGFYMSVRESISEPFGSPLQLNLMPDDNDHIACWLTDDELTAYFVMDRPVDSTTTALYRAERSARDRPFSRPVRIALQGRVRGFVSAPSLTADREYLYLYNKSPEGTARILEFRRTKKNAYRLHDALPSPAGLEPGPGQLAKNGLRYYVGVKESAHDKTLGYYSRSSLSEPFGSFAFIEGRLADTSLPANQPTLSADESILVFSVSHHGSWSGNYLHIAERRSAEVFVERPGPTRRALPALSLYPNPVTDVLYVDLPSESPEGTVVLVFDGSGRTVRQLDVSGQGSRIEIDMSRYPSGSYSCQMRGSDGVSGLHGFVVVR